jgi:uncharacterized RDD family membrane protein YckC
MPMNEWYQEPQRDGPESWPAYPRAPWERRLLAFVLDGLIGGLILTVCTVGFIAVIFCLMTYRPVPFLENAGEWVFYVWLLVTILGAIWFFFYSLFRDGLGGGQSLGKRLCGLRVIDLRTGRPCDATTAMKRNLLGLATVLITVLVPCTAPIMLLEPVALLADAHGQRLGDRWAGTQVVAEDEARHHGRLQG